MTLSHLICFDRLWLARPSAPQLPICSHYHSFLVPTWGPTCVALHSFHLHLLKAGIVIRISAGPTTLDLLGRQPMKIGTAETTCTQNLWRLQIWPKNNAWQIKCAECLRKSSNIRNTLLVLFGGRCLKFWEYWVKPDNTPFPIGVKYRVYLNTAVQPYLKLKWPRNGWLLGWFVGFTAWFLRFLFIYNCIYIYNYIYIIYSYITNDILYLIPWSSYQKHHSLEWVNSPLSLSHSNESSWKITWNPWYSHEKSGQIIIFHRN